MSGVQRIARRIALGIAAAVALVAAWSESAGAAPVSPTTRLHITITLRPRDPAALAKYAHAASTPGSDSYLHYLTPRQFRRRFGPTPAQIARVRRSLRARGLRPGPAAVGGLSIPLHAT